MRVLLMMRGSPGCGKSTWIREHGLEQYTLCADDIRMLCSSPRMTVDGGWNIDASNDATVWKMLFQLLEIRMQNGDFTVIDATNSKSTEMNKYKALCDEYKYRMYCVDMTDIPIEVVKERNLMRDPCKWVPDAAIDKMYSRFATQKIPSGITVIKPDELYRVFFKKIDLSSYDRIHVIGDIHGCATALADYKEKVGHWLEKDCWIFTGDYIDRGMENADVVSALLSVYDKDNVFLLEGNHERWLWLWANDKVCPSKEFELVTKTQLEEAGIDKKSVRKLYRRIGQCAWFDYHGKEFFITHAGVSFLPENPTMLATAQMIKGVGNYNDFEQVESIWHEVMPENCIQIHGHRNTKNLPIKVNDNNYNLEGRVEFGGCLRALQITKDGIETFEIPNRVFRPAEEMFQYKFQNGQQKLSIPNIILEMRNSKYIQEKKFGNISSFNFTRSAFYDKAWNDMTTKARGLFINIPKAKIVARSYDKFFNLGEREETKLENLQNVLQFPVHAYVKENGFLGMISYNEETDDLFVTTKSNPEGNYAQWLREDLYRQCDTDDISFIREYCKNHNVTMVVECVDVERDPHVIAYPKTKIYLLDVVYNEIPFRKLPYEEVLNVGLYANLEAKELAYTMETWQEFFDWYNVVTNEDYLYHSDRERDRQIEGFVIEDAAGFMVKIKLPYYNFWKFMRGISQEVLRVGYLTHAKLSSLLTPEANYYYGWLKEYREQVLAANDDPDADVKDIVAAMPHDIITLRRMFHESEAGAPFKT